MRIGVLVRWVLDATLPLRVDEAGCRVVVEDDVPPCIVEPGDRVALSLALRLRRAVPDGSVVAWTVGPAGAAAALRHALAAGADEARHLLAGGGIGDPASGDEAGPEAALAARALATWLAAEGTDLFLCAGRTRVEGTSPLAMLVAAHLDWPALTDAVGVEVERAGARRTAPPLVVERRLERGWRERVEVALPAVVAVASGAAEPRYVSRLALERVRGRAVPGVGLDEALGRSPAGLPDLPAVVSVTPPRPRTRRSATISAGVSAADRMRALVGGAKNPASAGAIVEGPPAQLAERLCQFLAEQGFASRPGGG